jgi:hypothetical protein
MPGYLDYDTLMASASDTTLHAAIATDHPYYISIHYQRHSRVVGQFEVNIKCMVDPRRQSRAVNMKLSRYRDDRSLDNAKALHIV